jgi:hypothetical protein
MVRETPASASARQIDRTEASATGSRNSSTAKGMCGGVSRRVPPGEP